MTFALVAEDCSLFAGQLPPFLVEHFATMFRLAEVAMCTLALTAGAALSLGIVWYVKNAIPESRKTLINRLVSYQVCFFLFFLNPAVSRYHFLGLQCLVVTAIAILESCIVIPGRGFGGFGPTFCLATVTLMRASIWSFYLSAIIIIILRSI